MLQVQLTFAGYEVEVAADGHEALELARARPPDAILLDILMPRIDGVDVCLRLQEDPATARVPVIFLSGLIGDDERVSGVLQLASVTYLSKGTRMPDMLETIRTMIAGRPAPC